MLTWDEHPVCRPLGGLLCDMEREVIAETGGQAPACTGVGVCLGEDTPRADAAPGRAGIAACKAHPCGL